MAELEEKTDEGVDIDKALKRIMNRYRSKFDNLFDYNEPDDFEAENEDEETEEDWKTVHDCLSFET